MADIPPFIRPNVTPLPPGRVVPPFVRPLRPASTALKELGDAANEAAQREAPQWFYFVTIMIMLTAIVGSTTHRVLFLELPVRVPILGVELPLLGFYVTAPAIFLLLHFHLLAQMRLMAGKIGAYLGAAEQEARDDPVVLPRAIRRLDSFPLAQLLAARRRGERSVALWLMVWTTFAIAPVLLLLFFQVRFLPYQEVWVTWVHRGILMLDLAVLWWLWPMRGVRHHRTDRRCWAVPALTTIVVLLFAVRIATIPNEAVDAPPFGSIRAALFDGEPDRFTQRPASLFSRRLVLSGEILIAPEDAKAFRDDPKRALATIGRTTILRGRNLRDAVLSGADLRRVDLTAAQMRGARFNGAQIQGARFDWADLQDAHLDEAQMQGAHLIGAHMRGARLNGAHMQGARFDWAQMQGVHLIGAKMQGVHLDGAQLAGARLIGVQMQGARLDRAQMRDALLIGVQMQGVRLDRAQMRDALLIGAQMQGARLDRTEMQGALLVGVQMQGVRLDEAQLRDAWLAWVTGWRASRSGPGFGNVWITLPIFEAEPPCREYSSQPCERFSSWSDAAGSWIASIPEGDRRKDARAMLHVLFAAEDHPGFEDLRRSWSAHPPPDVALLADRLGGLACALEHAPHVARAIARQVETGRLPDGHRARLARRLADVQRCPGARDIDAEQRDRLIAVAEGAR